jgi:hypothetical protein
MSAALLERRVDPGAAVPAWLDDVTRRWQQVVADPSLSNLPYKIETTRSGQIVMSPARTEHSVYQAQVASALDRRLGAVVLTECAVATSEGVKVADVAWHPVATFAALRGDGVLVRAPEICVEIRSPSNFGPELLEKVRLYLDSGATEVWVVAADGSIRVHTAAGEADVSARMSPMPVLAAP